VIVGSQGEIFEVGELVQPLNNPMNTIVRIEVERCRDDIFPPKISSNSYHPIR
jgi:hypothetical protein